MSPMTDPIVRRRFLQVGARRVHYVRSGDGPPVVLVHSSPANVRLLTKEIAYLSRDFTVFAFDTPGFGLSQPLRLATMSVADLADALAETMLAARLPRCPVFGTHTGASIALELGVRHPDRVTGLVLDGVAAFTDAECAAWFGEYFRKLPVSDLGGHYTETWTRFRDQAIWFPWTARAPDALNDYDLSPPHSTHLWAQMYYEAAQHYEPAYRAAIFHGEAAIVAGVTALAVPAIFCATGTDMLHPHLDRLPPLKPDQAIVGIGNSSDRKCALIGKSFHRFGAAGDASPVEDAIGSSVVPARQFLDGPAGQLHLRHAGNRAHPALLLLHDAPGSSEQIEPLVARLSETFFVVAPDLPGNGESGAFGGAPEIGQFAAEAVRLLDALGVAHAAVYGVGFGASVALAIASDHAERVTGVALQGLLLADADDRADLRAHYAPPIPITADGGHWYQTWLMLRDSQIYWPWYAPRLGALRRVAADLSGDRLHRWTLDVMRARESYGHLIQAALRQDAAALLVGIAAPLAWVDAAETPLCRYADAALRLRPDATVIEFGSKTLAGDLAMRFDHSPGTNRVFSEAPT